MKIKTNLKKLVASIVLISIFCSFQVSNATVDGDKAGQAIASFAIDFVEKGYGARVKWYDVNLSDPSSYGLRGQAYQETTVGSMDVYYMDCVGWVNYAVHHATGLDDPGVRAGSNGFVAPPGGAGPYFDNVTGQDLKPGDILCNSHHVLVYVGNDKVIDSRSQNGLTYTTLEEYGNANYTSATYGPGANRVYDSVWRLNSTALALINPEDLAPIISGLDKKTSDLKKKKDGYYGMPSKGQFTGNSNPVANALKWLINKLSQIADYLVGIITMGIKIELIGWTTMFEKLVTDAVEQVTGTQIEASEEENTAGDTDPDAVGTPITSDENLYKPDATEVVDKKENERLTVEKIIYNQVPILDINVFDLKQAGGQDVKDGSTLSVIKNNIAQWYYAFRKIAIAALLVVLIYIGIRLAISSVASEKTKYKRVLVAWLVSFLIVFGIHYVMMFVINLNDYFVDVFANTDKNAETSLYETVRTKAYELKFTSGMTGTIMYMVLVYLLVRFLYVYLKRYLTINILVMISPIMGVSYAIDKIKDNKSQSFNAWLKDFTLTVFLQSVHAMIYTTFVVLALDLSDDSLAGILLAFIVLNFMLKAEKIVINIFGMEQSKALGNMVKSDSSRAILTGFLSSSLLKNIGKIYMGGARLTGRGIRIAGRNMAQIGGIVLPESTRYGFNTKYNNAMNKVFGQGNGVKMRRTNNYQTQSGIDAKINAQKRMKKALLRNNKRQASNFAKSKIKTTLKYMVAMPVMIMEPKTGIQTQIMLMTLQKGKRMKGKAGGLKTALAYATFPMAGAVIDNRQQAKKAIDELDKKDKKIASKIVMMEKAKRIEEKIIEDCERIKQEELNILSSDYKSTEFKNSLEAKYQKDFDNMVENLIKEVDKSEISKVVQEYMQTNHIKEFEESDINEALEKLKDKLDSKPEAPRIELSVAAKKNVEQQVEKGTYKELAKELEISFKDVKADVTVDQKTKEKIVKEMKAIVLTTKDEKKLTAKLDTLLQDNDVKVSLSSADKLTVVRNLSKKIEVNKDKTYSADEVVDIIKKGLDRKGSIKRELVSAKYEEVAADIQELNDLNKKYEQEHKQAIFTNEELIEAIKKDKRSKKFDLYSSLMEPYAKPKRKGKGV